MKKINRSQTRHAFRITLGSMLLGSSFTAVTFNARAEGDCVGSVSPTGECTIRSTSSVHVGFAMRGEYMLLAGSNATQHWAMSESDVTHHSTAASHHEPCDHSDFISDSTGETQASCPTSASVFRAFTTPPNTVLISCPGGPGHEEIIIGGGGIIGEPIPGLCPRSTRTGWVETVNPYPDDGLHFDNIRAVVCECDPDLATPGGCCELCIPNYDACVADGPPTNSYFEYDVAASGMYSSNAVSTATLRAEMSISGELIDHIAVGQASMQPGAYWRLDYLVKYTVDDEQHVDAYFVEIRYTGRDTLELDYDGWEIIDSNVMPLTLIGSSDVDETYRFQFGPFKLKRNVPLPADHPFEVSVTSSAGTLAGSAMAAAARGDLVGNGSVDWHDLVHLVSKIGTIDSRADVNGDGVVDALDVARWIELYIDQDDNN